MGKTLIVIPTVGKNERQLYNEQTVQECITSIEENTTGEYEIYLSVNDYVGFAYAVNLALKDFLDNTYYRDFDGIILLNDDMVIFDKEWLQKFLAKANEEVGLITQEQQNHGWYAPMGCCYLPREIIKKVGLLDERFTVLEWEDIDYNIRVIEAGYKTISLGVNVAKHGDSIARTNAPKWAKEEIKKNKKRFIAKYKGTEYLERLGLK